MYRPLFARDVLAELDRLQRDLGGILDPSPAIRGLGRGGYPALNVGGTAESVEVYAFAPGLDPASVAVDLERGVLTISGERPAAAPPAGDAKATVHMNERFSGRFRRVVSLPDDIDPSAVTAACRDGVVHVSIKRRSATQPRRIQVQ
jgi:HSP20 family protein